MAEPGTQDGIEPVIPPPAEPTPDVTSLTPDQRVNQEALSPQDVGAALIAEDRRLGGKMGLAIVPTAIGSSSGEASTTIFFPSLKPAQSYGKDEYRAYGVNSDLGLVYYVDKSATDDSWALAQHRLRGKQLSDYELQPVKTPQDMEAWTKVLNERRKIAEILAAREATQTEFERSLNGRAMEAIMGTPQATIAQPQTPSV